MSYILDALDKAERERKRGQVPSLQTGERSTEARGPRSPWLWVALFAVIFNALLAGLLVYSTTRDTKPAPTLPAIVEPAPVVPTPAPTTATLDPPIHRAAPPVEAPAVLLMTDQELQTQARALEMESTPPADPVPAEPTPAPAPVVAARASVDTPLEMLPLLVEMPQQLQQALPPFRVDVHVHASQAENRFVMINLRRYHEGDEVATGLVLERITKEGLVLSFQGERFRYLLKM